MLCEGSSPWNNIVSNTSVNIFSTAVIMEPESLKQDFTYSFDDVHLNYNRVPALCCEFLTHLYRKTRSFQHAWVQIKVEIDTINKHSLTFVSSGRPGISNLHPWSSVRCKCSLFILYIAMISMVLMTSCFAMKPLATSSISPRNGFLGASITVINGRESLSELVSSKLNSDWIP